MFEKVDDLVAQFDDSLEGMMRCFVHEKTFVQKVFKSLDLSLSRAHQIEQKLLDEVQKLYLGKSSDGCFLVTKHGAVVYDESFMTLTTERFRKTFKLLRNKESDNDQFVIVAKRLYNKTKTIVEPLEAMGYIVDLMPSDCIYS